MRPIDWRKAIYKADVAPLTKLVLYTISIHINPAQEYVFPSIRTIANGAGVAKSTAQEHVDKAVAFGLLIKENTRRKAGGKGSNRYLTNIPDDLYWTLKHDDREAVIADDREPVQGVPGAGHLVNKTTKQEEANASKPGQLPEWLDAGAWAEWKRYRSESKNPLTPTAASRLIVKLGNLVDDGYDAAVLIHTAIDRGWRGIYPCDEARGAGNTKKASGIPVLTGRDAGSML